MTTPGQPRPTPTDPLAVLDSDALPGPARTWLREAAASVAVRPNALRVLFPAARRRCGQERLDAYWTVDEAARAVLLAALPYRGRALADQVTALYHHGGPAEQRAVLKALPYLGERGAEGEAVEGDGRGEREAFTAPALDLVREALRGDDTSVVQAALGPFAAAHLPDDEYRQAVLMCVRSGIPLARVAFPEEA
ncbi:EboA domain-containing protein [Streptomyces sp. NPDC002920]